MSQWYVRSRGRVMGPFDDAQVRSMYEDGQLQEYNEVSPDRRSWKPLGLTGLLGGRPTPPGTEAVPARPASGAYKTVIIASAAVIVALAGVAAAIYWGGLGGGADGRRTGLVNLDGLSSTEALNTVSEAVCLIVVGSEQIEDDGERVETGIPGKIERVVDKSGRATYRTRLGLGSGTGFAVTRRGHIITNRHVVDTAVNYERSSIKDKYERLFNKKTEPKVWVFLGRDRKYEADILFVSQDYDLAVLKIDREFDTYFALSSTPPGQMPVRELVYVFGFPGKDRSNLLTRMEGGGPNNIKSPAIQSLFKGRDFNCSRRRGAMTKRVALYGPFGPPLNWHRRTHLVQHDAQSFQGNSGGPLVAADGTVIGVTTLGLPDDSSFSYAVSLPQLRSEIDEHAPGVIWREAAE